MVSLAERRPAAEHLETEHGASERRACQVIGIARSTKRRPSGRIEEAKLVRRVHELTDRYPRFEYRKIHAVLRSEGFPIGRDRLRLIRKREGLVMPLLEGAKFVDGKPVENDAQEGRKSAA